MKFSMIVEMTSRPPGGPQDAGDTGPERADDIAATIASGC